MKRALALLALAAVVACAPEPQAPVIVLGEPAAPSPPPAPAAPAPPDPPPEPPAVSVAAPAPGTTPDVVRDPRDAARMPRAWQLPAAEVSALAKLLAATPQASPDRPRLLLQVADLHAEIERAAAHDPAQAKRAAAARREAIRHYQMLVNDHPRWCTAPLTAQGSGCVDEALYFLGLEQERDGDVTAARQSYFQLVRDWPQSRLVPSAYLAFGELFLAESDADPAKLPLAEQAYVEALKYPPPDNAVFGHAQLRIGQVRLRRGGQRSAVKSFQAAIAWASRYPTALGAAPVAAAAQEALARLGVP